MLLVSKRSLVELGSWHLALRLWFGRVAQLAEHSTLNRQVVGSIPTASTIPFTYPLPLQALASALHLCAT